MTGSTRVLGVGVLVMMASLLGCRHSYPEDDGWEMSGCIPDDDFERDDEPVTRTRPSVIGWDAETSRALSRHMADAPVFVVAYGGGQLRVLEDCEVLSTTRYQYRTLGDNAVDEARLVSAEQLRERMPLAPKREVTPEQAHRLSRTHVGSWFATGAPVGLDALEGDCADATHLVTSAEVGAYELYRSEDLIDRRGVFRACTSDPVARTPPEGCDNILRLELSTLTPTRRVVLAPPETTLEPGPDPAAMSDDERMEYAKQLYIDGDAAFNMGDYALALVKFETAYRVYVPSIHLFNFNIALSAWELGDCAKAKVAFQRFLDLIPDHPGRGEATERLLDIERSGCARGR